METRSRPTGRATMFGWDAIEEGAGVLDGHGGSPGPLSSQAGIQAKLLFEARSALLSN